MSSPSWSRWNYLKTRFQGILLAATTIDATGSLFPLAYAVIDAVNDDNWLWMLKLVYQAIQQSAPHLLEGSNLLTFLSDRQKGLLDAVAHVFPNSPHGYCLRHLEENFHKQFKHPELKRLLWQAARATTREKFDETLTNMTKINGQAVPWLYENAHPQH